MDASMMPRRDFLKTAAVAGAGYVLANSTLGAGGAKAAGVNKIDTFDYTGVTLRPSRWQRQYQACRDFYFGVSDDDILCGYRRAANLPAPGAPLGGWCATNSNTVLGQWFQGMTRIARATGDKQMQAKAIRLFTEWVKTLPQDGSSRMGHYPFEKLVGGLVDLKMYAGHDEAVGVMEKAVNGATTSLDRTRTPAAPRPWPLHSGTPLEWYTLAENLYRAYLLTGQAKYKEFADVWRYDAYWSKLAETADPTDAYGVHAYSHVNTWSSCAMAYAVTGDPKLLQTLKNAYDFLQNTQCFATGGYGPVERIMPTNGNLGVALETRQNTCETPCCSWAAFKMARYLMTFTGEARYGDWLERLLYNGIGAALPITENGKNFYYADYRVAGGYKTYARSTYTCCSGTYIQAVAEYPNLIYMKDAGGLYVNLYVPSEVTWGDVKVVQETAYPEAETSTLTVSVPQAKRFALKFRVPGWSKGVTASVNGTVVNVAVIPGMWGTIDREWANGDKVEIKIPLTFRFAPVDKWHPDRVAVVRGAVVMVQDASVHEPIFGLPATDAELNQVLFATGPGQRDPGLPPAPPSQFALRLTGKNLEQQTAANMPGGRGGGAAPTPQAGAHFMPFYSVQEVNAYRMYFDRTDAPKVLW